MARCVELTVEFSSGKAAVQELARLFKDPFVSAISFASYDDGKEIKYGVSDTVYSAGEKDY